MRSRVRAHDVSHGWQGCLHQGVQELATSYGNDGGGESALTHTSGGRVKMASLDDPCLFLGYFAPGRALMAERPWKEVLKRIPEPLYRHRFGT